jgi:hypothetical protein
MMSGNCNCLDTLAFLSRKSIERPRYLEMPTPTSTRTTPAGDEQVFADYVLHHSAPESLSGQSSAFRSSNIDEVAPPSNPDWWRPTNHRRVSAYRPINRSLDGSQRPNGTSLVGIIFIFTMLRGVQLNAVRLSTRF